MRSATLFLFLWLFIIPAKGQQHSALRETGYINALTIGLKQDVDMDNTGQATDNYPVLQHYLDSLPQNTIAGIYFPAGGYYFSKSILVRNKKGIDFKGVTAMPYPGYKTVSRLFFAANQNGISIIGGRLDSTRYTDGALTSSVSDLGVVSYGTAAGNSTFGIYHEVICSFTRVFSQAFGYGFYTFASVEYPMYGNTSLSIYTSCRAVQNKQDGFYAGGPDANAITYLNCVSVENYRWGFLDSSLLGNFYYGCQTATNGRMGSESHPATQGGGFGVLQADAHSIISGCYSESDQLPNYISPANAGAIAIGGIHANGWCGNLPEQPYKDPGGSVQVGSRFNSIATKHIDAGEIALKSIYLRNSTLYGQGAKAGIYDSNSTPLFEAISNGVPASPVGSPAGDQPMPRRAVPGKSIYLHPTQWIGNQLNIYGDTGMKDVVFLYGDKIMNDAWKDGQPDHWRVIRAGRNHSLKGNELGIATMRNYDSGNLSLQNLTLTNDAAYSLLKTGDVLNMPNGALGQVWSIDSESLIEVYKPKNTIIKEGEKIDWMGGWMASLQPVNYTDSTITLHYNNTPEPLHKTGEQVIVDGAATTIKSVVVKNGVQLVELNLPAGYNPALFAEGAHIGWTAANINREPAYYDHTDPKQPTVTIAFPMAELQPSAGVWVNGIATTVKKIIKPGIAVKALIGNVLGNSSGTFKVQKPLFKAVGL